MHVLVISNPNSTSQDADLFRQIIPVLRGVEGLTMVSKMTHRPGHAEEMVRGLTRADYDAVIAVGGDGTVNEVVNGLLGPVKFDESGQPTGMPDPKSLPTLGIIPTGSANVFVRALGFPAGPIDATHVLARMLERDLRRTIWLGTWKDRWFAVNAGFGLDADVLARVDRAREKGFSATPLRYLSVAVHAYQRARLDPPEISVRAVDKDGKEFTMNNSALMLASNTNPWTFLGPLPVVTNPRNSFDGGLGLFGLSNLDGIGGIIGFLHLIGADRNRVLNRISEARTVQFDDAMTVELHCPEEYRFQADGESEGALTSATLHSVPNALEVFAPMDAGEPHKRTIRQILRDLVTVK